MADEVSLETIIDIIECSGLENEVLDYLVKNRIKHIKRLEHDQNHLSATIKCIKATNGGKNEAIDALCEPESDAERRKRYRLSGIY